MMNLRLLDVQIKMLLTMIRLLQIITIHVFMPYLVVLILIIQNLIHLQQMMMALVFL